MLLALEETLIIGTESFFKSGSPVHHFAVVFEDNTETGYFYAVDLINGLHILDALHIYNVEDVVDGQKPGKVQIWWNDAGNIASLLINSYFHAIIDFSRHAGYCRNAFPPANDKWSWDTNRILTDELIKEIFE